VRPTPKPTVRPTASATIFRCEAEDHDGMGEGDGMEDDEGVNEGIMIEGGRV
jgi:hypothetical protein